MNISDFAHIAFQAGYIVAEFDFASSPTGCRIYRTYWRFPRIAAPYWPPHGCVATNVASTKMP
jgi:hypothetical protein